MKPIQSSPSPELEVEVARDPKTRHAVGCISIAHSIPQLSCHSSGWARLADDFILREDLLGQSSLAFLSEVNIAGEG